METSTYGYILWLGTSLFAEESAAGKESQEHPSAHEMNLLLDKFFGNRAAKQA